MSEKPSKIFYEKLLIQYLFTDVEVRDRLVPYLISDVFMNHINSKIVENILKFMVKHEHFPRMNELKLFITDTEVYEQLQEIMGIDSSEYGRDFILGELEEFYRKSMYANVLMESQENIKNDTNTLQSYPDKLRDALSFTFDNSIGLSLLEDQEKIFTALHDKDRVISTGIKYLDRLIEGGCHEKSLNLLLAACVIDSTKVNIRYENSFGDYIYQNLELFHVEHLLEKYKVQVYSPDGWIDATGYVKKGLQNVYKLNVGPYELIGSAKHLIETFEGWKFLEDIRDGDLILTISGYCYCNIVNLNREEFVVDLTVNSLKYRYYTNGISSHNTNVGKSLCMCGLSVNFLKQNKKVLYISLEMSEEKILERILANIFDTDLADLKKMSKLEFMRKFELVKNVLKSDFKTIQYPAKTISANKIRSILKELQMKKGFTPDVLIVDYMGLMITNSRNKDSNSYTEMKLISEELRSVAVECGFPIWSAMQTNRNGFKNTELEMTDIADSIGTAATADLIIGVAQSDELRAAGKYIWYILKNRYGINEQKLYVGVDYPKMRIYGLDSEDVDEIVRPKNIIDQASVDVLKTLKNNKMDKKSKLTGIE